MRLVVLVLTCFLLTGCTKWQSSGPGIPLDPKLTALVPSAATAAAGIDLDRLKASTLFQHHASILDGLALLAPAGLNLLRDASSVVAFLVANEPGLLLRGNLLGPDLSARLLRNGGQLSKYRGRSLVQIGPGASWNVFFPSGGLAATGPPGVLHTLIDQDSSLGLSETLSARLRGFSASDQVWATTNSLLYASQISARTDVRSILSSLNGYVNGAAAGIGFDSGVHVQVDLACFSAGDAQQVRAALHAGIAFARLSTREQQKPLLQMYSAIQTAVEGSTVHLRMDLGPAESDALLALYLPDAARLSVQ